MSQRLDDCKVGREVAAEADAYREMVRWRVRRSDPDRQACILELLEAIDVAMKPIRSHIGRLAHEPVPMAEESELRQVSQALQYQRRQLKKMR